MLPAVGLQQGFISDAGHHVTNRSFPVRVRPSRYGEAICRPVSHDALGIRCRHGLAELVALPVLASSTGQVLQDGPVLNAFRRRRQPETPCKA
jgi:hypothetical protein